MDLEYLHFLNIAFVISFFVFWYALLAIFSIAGGWKAMADEFPVDEKILSTQEIAKYRFSTVRLKFFLRYRNCVTIKIFKEGVYLKPVVLFSFLHPPVFIPFSKIKNVQLKGESIFKRCVIETGDHRFSIAWYPGEQIYNLFNKGQINADLMIDKNNKKYAAIGLGIVFFIIFFPLLFPLLLRTIYPGSGVSIEISEHCGKYIEVEEGKERLYGTCKCIGIRRRVGDYSYCYGYRVDYFE